MSKSYNKLYLDSLRAYLAESSASLAMKSSPEKLSDETFAKELNSAESESFLSENYKKKLRSVLGDPEKFRKCTTSQKKAYQRKINKLSYTEYEWKTTKNKITFDPSLSGKIFPKAFLAFQDALSPRLILDRKDIKSQRADQISVKMKILHVITSFSEFMVENRSIRVFARLTNLTEEDINIMILTEYISPSWIFHDLVRLLYKKSHENLSTRIKHASKHLQVHYKLSDNVLTVKRHQVIYDYADIFLMYLINMVFIYLEETEKLTYDFQATQREVRYALKQKKFLLDYSSTRKHQKQPWWVTHLTNTFIVLSCLESTSFFSSVVKDTVDNTLKTMSNRGKQHQEVKYILPVSLLDSGLEITELPKVVKPTKATADYVDDILKPVVFGDGGTTKSRNLLKTLDITQGKEFKVNPTYYGIISFFYDMPINHPLYSKIEELVDNKKIKLPFSFTRSLVNSRDKLRQLECLPIDKTFNTFLRDILRKQFLGTAVSSYSTPQIKSLTGLTPIEAAILNTTHQENLELFKQQMQRKHAKTLLELAEIYMGFPMFITETLCIRLRLYPGQPWISRTSGIYKHLATDAKSLKITKTGLTSLLTCYYAPDKNLSHKLNVLSTSVRNLSFKKQAKFFYDHPLDFSQVKDIMYFSYLHIQIERVLSSKNKHTEVCVEIDQNASGITLLAYFFRNRKMAEVCNLLGGEKTSPYDYCMMCIREFYESNFENRNEKVIQFLESHRKLNKYALMCFSYSQTHIGRMEDFREFWIQEFQESPTDDEKKVLDEFATRYKDFLDTIFPGFKTQIELILQIVELVVVDTGELKVRTLEGEVLTWKFFKHESVVRTVIDPLLMEQKNIRVRSFIFERDSNDNKEKLVTATTAHGQKLAVDLPTFKKNFLSYMAHSIDSAVMRRFIRVMYEKYNYRINHLHDCAICHPNYVDSFYDEVKILYESHTMYNMVENLFFSQVRHSLSTDVQVEFDALTRQFYENTDDFRSEISVDPKQLYSPESSA